MKLGARFKMISFAKMECIKLLMLLFIMIISISLVDAIEINDTTLNATSSNIVVKIFEWVNVTNITVESNYIFFSNFSKTSYIYNKNTENAVVLIGSGVVDYNFTTTNTIFYVWQNATGLPSSPPPSGGGGGSPPPICNSLWLWEDLEFKNKFLNIAMPLPDFMQLTFRSSSPKSVSLLKYWLALEYTSKESLSTSIRVIGIRILTLIALPFVFLLWLILRSLKSIAKMSS